MYDSVGDGSALRPHRTRPASAGSRISFYFEGEFFMGAVSAATGPAFIFGANYGCGGFSASFGGQNAPSRNITFRRTLAFLSHVKAQAAQLSV
jgi:hypothetical protein